MRIEFFDHLSLASEVINTKEMLPIRTIRTEYEIERQKTGKLGLMIPAAVADKWGSHIRLIFDGTTLTVAGRGE